MKNEYTGPLREQWNYFKRGKSELNFLLNIFQTVIMIWAAGTVADIFGDIITFSIIFAIGLAVASLIVGKYSLTRVDTSIAYINPFAQDIVVFRRELARGLEFMAKGDNMTAQKIFYNAQDIVEKWMVEK